jgi:Spy/CpxP family protein refolding chaperone
MKKMILFAICIVFAVATKAQSNTDEVALVQSAFGMTKQQMVKDFMKLSDTESAKFWTLYEEYEAARKEMGKKRIANITAYADNYDKLSNEKATELMNKSFAIQGEFAKLQQKTFKKMSKELSPLRAAQFTMLESFIENSIRTEILDAIPLIGEFDDKK